MTKSRYKAVVVVKHEFGYPNEIEYGTWRWLWLAIVIVRLAAMYQDYCVVPTHYLADGEWEEYNFEISYYVKRIN
jgi:hypothetical protein